MGSLRFHWTVNTTNFQNGSYFCWWKKKTKTPYAAVKTLGVTLKDKLKNSRRTCFPSAFSLNCCIVI